MTFDKSKVFTSVNANEVKIGSKGFFAETLAELKSYVKIEIALDEVAEILDDGCAFRFCSDNRTRYALFYLVEEPKEQKYRPYKDTDEMIADFLERYNNYSKTSNCHNPMYNPLIWIKDKAIGVKELITQSFGDSANGRSMEQLFKEFIYLDGSPCGKLAE